MGLSCECRDWDWEGDGWGYYYPEDIITLQTKRRRRCCSCRVLIDIGADCVKFNRIRYPQDEIEEKIHGEDGEILLAPWYMCSICGEIYLNLTTIGYCPQINDDMREDIKEYHQMTGWKP